MFTKAFRYYVGTLAIGGKPDEIRGRMLRISNCQRLRGKKLNIRSLTVSLLNWACKVNRLRSLEVIRNPFGLCGAAAKYLDSKIKD